jgi:hypothetical protein
MGVNHGVLFESRLFRVDRSEGRSRWTALQRQTRGERLRRQSRMNLWHDQPPACHGRIGRQTNLWRAGI